jgi:hypothetical protein
MVMDSTDPVLFAEDATHPEGGPGPSLYVLQVLFDESVPNSGTERVARLMGIPQIEHGGVEVSGLERVSAPFQAGAAQPTRALLVETMGTHGRNLTSRKGSRTAKTPFPREDAALDERIVYLPAPVSVRQPLVFTQQSMVRFLDSALASGSGSIDVEGLEPWVDFDDDGWTDEEEAAGGTDPFDPDAHPPGEPTHPRNLGF